jgi:hypothetical protein
MVLGRKCPKSVLPKNAFEAPVVDWDGRPIDITRIAWRKLLMTFSAVDE